MLRLCQSQLYQPATIFGITVPAETFLTFNALQIFSHLMLCKYLENNPYFQPQQYCHALVFAPPKMGTNFKELFS